MCSSVLEYLLAVHNFLKDELVTEPTSVTHALPKLLEMPDEANRHFTVSSLLRFLLQFLDFGKAPSHREDYFFARGLPHYWLFLTIVDRSIIVVLGECRFKSYY